MPSTEHILTEITRSNIKLLLEEPFYGHFFSGLQKTVSEETDTISLTGGSGQLFLIKVNPQYWQHILSRPELRTGALKHQILHLVLKHPFRRQQFGNSRLFDIAADLVVNQYLDPEQLTEDAITLQQFPGLEAHREVDYYYQALTGRMREPEDNASSTRSGTTAAGAGEHALQDMLSSPHPQLDQHREWQPGLHRSGAGQQMLESGIDTAIQRALDRLKSARSGRLPAGLEAYLETWTEKRRHELPWRRVVRLFTQSSSRTRLRNTIRRPSKRYGIVPGIRVEHKHKILVAVDTSGSITLPELEVFFSEVHHLWRQGVELRVVECDASIQRSYLYRGKMPEIVSGRGGTDFTPPIRYANETYLPDAVIYFTDGMAPPPDIPSRRPILWVISAEGIARDHRSWQQLPGRKIKLNLPVTTA